MSAPNRFGSNASKALLTAVGNLQGEFGIRYINNTSEQRGNWTSLRCVTAAVFTKLTLGNNDGDAMDTISMAAGDVLSLGNILAIQLASGSVVAYRARP